MEAKEKKPEEKEPEEKEPEDELATDNELSERGSCLSEAMHVVYVRGGYIKGKKL